ncbi:MAG: hypothetical protein WD069_15060 [Planctomycetales bacterium]
MTGRRVLVVDGLDETEQVLKAVLEPRGLRVDRVRAAAPSRIASREPPHLLVLHEDGAGSIAPKWRDVPRIVIGRIRERSGRPSDAARHDLPHPFEYGELIAAIERLLAAPARAAG